MELKLNENYTEDIENKEFKNKKKSVFKSLYWLL